jgi:hypothetical protein
MAPYSVGIFWRARTVLPTIAITEVVMDAAKRKGLDAAGWRFGDAADFLWMTEDERKLLDVRIDAAHAARRLPAPGKSRNAGPYRPSEQEGLPR